MTKHFADEEGSCVLGEFISLAELVKRGEPPKPPPMREYRGYTRVNEYKTVDWYTDAGKLYPEGLVSARIPKTWFFRLFMTEDQKILEKSLMKNRMLCTEWLR